ncbi:hypothetical protein FPCIR_4317 [Fusarium pseudocircinatum]|uniref:Uncharacterized protein n=1 Tax=Fusarium pseudocircinatum TaxID=56676 RepID=A0A8H5PF80_9HYPO|nr:hypothetical protein FPCIR_4317 [Fusarium pseudocircinatum]
MARRRRKSPVSFTSHEPSTESEAITVSNPSYDSYPKHVWSPAGGWYAQPANWRANTLIAGVVMAGIVAVTWKFSAGREQWAHRPEQGQWYASRQYAIQYRIGEILSESANNGI